MFKFMEKSVDKRLIDSFANVLNDFLDDIYKSYPDPSLFILMQTSKGIASVSPLLLLKNFKTCIKPYVKQIKERDSSFFLNGGLADNLFDTSYSFLVEEINKVAQIWSKPETSEKTKDSIWKYFNILVSISNKVDI